MNWTAAWDEIGTVLDARRQFSAAYYADVRRRRAINRRHRDWMARTNGALTPQGARKIMLAVVRAA